MGELLAAELYHIRTDLILIGIYDALKIDLKFCKAYISVLGDQDAVDSTFAGLNSAMGYIRRELAHSVNLRNTPEITFIMDQSIEYGVSMSHKIDEALGKHGDADESTDENSESEDEFEE